MSGGAAIRIGTRGSQLALRQAGTVARLLDSAGILSELVTIRTTGDRMQDVPLSAAGGKRLFVKEIEEALLDHEIDVAVHSAKDMAVDLPEGLTVAATLAREDPRDAIVMPVHTPAGDLEALRDKLGDRPAFGTGSVRRAAQLAGLFPRAAFAAVRGNVDSRLRKLDDGAFDALVLACAGLRRLGLAARITAALSVEQCVPAPGQGIVAIEIRTGDEATRRGLESMHDASASVSLTAEQALVRALGGGCHLPLGAVALHDNGELDMHAVVASPDGRHVIRRRGRGRPGDALGLGRRLADELARAGARDILDAARHAPASADRRE